MMMFCEVWMTSCLQLVGYIGGEEQFDDVWMTKEFEVLNFSFDTIVCVTTQFRSINKLERDELFRLLMLSNYSRQCQQNLYPCHRVIRLTFPKDPSPRVLT